MPVEIERRHEKISAKTNGFRTDNATGATIHETLILKIQPLNYVPPRVHMQS